MTDGIQLNKGEGGDLLAAKDAGVSGKWQQVLASYLLGGTPTAVDATNKLPVDTGLTGLATSAKQDSIISALAALATSAKQDTIITALGTLATEATVATLGTESTLATRLSETTGQAIRDELDAVIQDPSNPPATPNQHGVYARIGVGDSPAIDSFNRFRTSEIKALFDSQNQYEKNRQFDEALAGTGTATHNVNHSAVELRTSAASDSVIRQSFEYVPYEPGRSLVAFMSFVPYDNQAGVTKRVGLFDTNNGIFLESNGTNFRVVRRTETGGSPADTAVDQASWNIDSLDGTGPSGVTIDWGRIQLMVIDYEWMGAGRARIGFVFGGLIHWVHEFNNANIGTVVWSVMGNLPVRFEIVQAGATPGSLDQISSAVFSEGGDTFYGDTRSVAIDTAVSVSNSQWYPVLSIRPKLLYNSLQNRKVIQVVKMWTIGTTVNDLIIARVVWGGTLTTPSFSDPGSAYAAEVDIAAAPAAVSGGIVIASGAAGAESELELDQRAMRRFALGLNISAAHPTSPYTDVMSLEVRSIATSASVVSGVTWQEGAE